MNTNQLTTPKTLLTNQLSLFSLYNEKLFLNRSRNPHSDRRLLSTSKKNNTLPNNNSIIMNSTSKIKKETSSSTKKSFKIENSLLLRLKDDITELSNENTTLIKKIRQNKIAPKIDIIKTKNQKEEINELKKFKFAKGVFINRRNGDKVFFGEKNNVFTKCEIVQFT